MYLTIWAALAMFAVYFWTGANARYFRKSYQWSYSRGSYWEAMPARSHGPANLVLQLALLVTPLCLFALLDVHLSAAYGLLWCACRLVHRLGFCEAPAPRAAGFLLGMVPCMLLVAGTVSELLPV
jgi:glutathione S-transferase